MKELGTLGGSESFAYDINDLGQIVGWAKTGTGQTHAVLWDPVMVAEPVSAILFSVGGAALGFRKYRKKLGYILSGMAKLMSSF